MVHGGSQGRALRGSSKPGAGCACARRFAWAWPAAGVAAGLCLATAFQGPARAQETAPPALVRSLVELRATGCAGRPRPPLPGLRTDAELSEAARRVAEGHGMKDALAAAGYRANSSLLLRLQGVDSRRQADEAARFLARRYCGELLQPEWREIGLHQAGAQTWLLLAAPFEPPAPEQAQGVAARVLALVNEARTRARSCGDRRMEAAPPLRPNTVLAAAAQAHAQDMARRNYFSHTGRDGSAPGDRATRAGYDWRAVGENIAAGQQSAETVVAGWLASPGHCVNIMQRAFSEMGVAFAVEPKSERGIYWAQMFGTAR